MHVTFNCSGAATRPVKHKDVGGIVRVKEKKLEVTKTTKLHYFTKIEVF